MQRLVSLKTFDIFNTYSFAMDILIIKDGAGEDYKMGLLRVADALNGLPSSLEVRPIPTAGAGDVSTTLRGVFLSPEALCRSLSCSRLSISRSRRGW